MMTKPKGWVSFAAFGCEHAPYEDWEVIEKRAKIVQDLKPDYIIYLGDLFNADAGGNGYDRYLNIGKAALLDEYKAAAKVLRRYSKAAPRAKKVYMEGNHEVRVRTADRIPKELLGIIDYRDPSRTLGKELQEWEWRPYISPDRRLSPRGQGLYRIGQVTFLHGFEWGANSDRQEAQLYGVEYGLTVRSHTHKPLPVTRVMLSPTIPTNRWVANCGTGSNIGVFKTDYAGRRNTSLWGDGIVVGSCCPHGLGLQSRHWQAAMLEL